MRITIDTDILSKNNLSLGEYLVLLLGYNNCNFEECFGNLVDKHFADIDKKEMGSIVLSGNVKNLITRLLLESDERIKKSPVKDFYLLASELRLIYPHGCKTGTSYVWNSTVEDVAQKLMCLVVVYDFVFTRDEAVKATREYVDSFKSDRKHMKLLPYFLLRTNRESQEIESDFMTIIENNRWDKIILKDENNNR